MATFPTRWGPSMLEAVGRSVLMLGLVAALLSGCAVKKGDQRLPADTKAHEEWARNIQIVERAVAGGTIRGTEFEDACVFFEAVTGIAVHGNGSTIGYLPTDDTRQDLESLRRWYEAYGQHLSWDEETNEVTYASGG